jgi:hypothetical protein
LSFHQEGEIDPDDISCTSVVSCQVVLSSLACMLVLLHACVRCAFLCRRACASIQHGMM